MPDDCDLSEPLALAMARLPREVRQDILASLTDDQCLEILYDWRIWARPQQLPPAGDWQCWLVMAGRGFGKTRLGAEWVRYRIEGQTPLVASPNAPRRLALVSRSFADARDVMVEGESGLLAVAHPDQRPNLEVSRRRLVWPNGVVAQFFSSEEPELLRGPEHGLAWADELAKWRNIDATWTNLMLGLRRGASPQVVVTTTPRPIRLLRQLVDDDTVVVTRGSTFDNRPNLSASFLRHVSARYRDTHLGRQELDGELLGELPGALWTRSLVERMRVAEFPALQRIVVGVDPPVTSGPDADSCGIIVAGLGLDAEIYVLEDKSIAGQTPLGWASRVVDAYNQHRADRVVAETNQGGELVEALIRQVAPNIAFRSVHASRGKIARAEPVAALYERGLVHHVGRFDALEDEMCSYAGAPGEASPDRLDALVWGITDLVFANGRDPRIRSL